jgi:hypothetical protein
MSALLALALLLAPAPAHDFHDRVTQGKLAEGAAAGPAYQKQLWGKIGHPMTDALRGCIASNAPADKSPFTLVANVQADGRPASIEVQPETHLASCLAGQFAAWNLPPPPAQPRPYPIEIDISITP